MSAINTSYDKLVLLKYELYNGLFLTLPFPSLEEVGIKLPLFAERCKSALERGESPTQIIDEFFAEIYKTSDFEQKMEVLFLFTQFLERQVVLFDALEQAAFKDESSKEIESVPEGCRVRIVLTAHPTQFYPDVILRIIDSLAEAIRKDDIGSIEQILLQLGMTSFRNLEPPTPLSEAKSLLDRASDVFYPAILDLNPAIELGFWPGGDRDGNPFVDVATTLEVASSLRQVAMNHYKREIHALKKHLTFPGMTDQLIEIERNLEEYRFPEELITDLGHLHQRLVENNRGLFAEEVTRFQQAVRTFGFYFASLDLRQDSSIHEEIVGKTLESYEYLDLNEEKKAKLLEILIQKPPMPVPESDFAGSLLAVPTIQSMNGVEGLHRYIISNTQAAHHVLEVQFMMHQLNLDDLPLDIVPLFETVEDLQHADKIMKRLYQSPIYQKQLKKRGNRQIVMVGFSDGTKDGGYLTCNWEILKAKQRLEKLSHRHGIDIVFFDGRGGPPARGGGNTHKFYRAMGAYLHQKEVELTIQGQTISSQYGTREMARSNIAAIFTAVIDANKVPHEKNPPLLDLLSDKSYEAYSALRSHPLFVPFLEEKTPLSYYGKLNVASRPAKRGHSQELRLKDLRAIPFVGAWSQIKLNVPGFYGLGTALKWAFENGHGEEAQDLYQNNLFFSTLLDNAMQSLAKSGEIFTKYLLKDPIYGPFVEILHKEARETKEYLLKVSGQKELLQNDPINRQSIELREKLILPLLVIQQYALTELKKAENSTRTKAFEKLLLKTLPPIVNASRNSA